MRYTFALLALLVAAAPAAYAQESTVQMSNEGRPTLQQRLVPAAAPQLLAPASAEVLKDEAQPALPALRPRGSGTGLIIAGGALFVAGLLIGNDAGTVLAVTGAALGAYGLYLYFQ